MLPVLQMIFNVKTEKITKPQFSGSFIKYFDYLKDLALYTIQEKIHENGPIKVLALLCIVTAVAFLLRHI